MERAIPHLGPNAQRLCCDASDVHGRFFGFGGDVDARGDDEARVCVAVAVLDVEALEEDGCGCAHALSELEALAEEGDGCW